MDELGGAFILSILLFVIGGIGGIIGYHNYDHDVPVPLYNTSIELCRNNGGLFKLSIDSSEYTIVCNNSAEFNGSISKLEDTAEKVIPATE